MTRLVVGRKELALAAGATLVSMLHPFLWLGLWRDDGMALPVVAELLMLAFVATRVRAAMPWASTPRPPERLIVELDGFKTRLAAPRGAARTLGASVMAWGLWWLSGMFVVGSASPSADDFVVVFLSLLPGLLVSGAANASWAWWRSSRTATYAQRVGHVFRAGGRSVVLTPDVAIALEPGRLAVGPVVVEDEHAVLAWLAAELNAHRLPAEASSPTAEAAKLAGLASAAAAGGVRPPRCSTRAGAGEAESSASWPPRPDSERRPTARQRRRPRTTEGPRQTPRISRWWCRCRWTRRRGRR
jgi:hypothetical protein